MEPSRRVAINVVVDLIGLKDLEEQETCEVVLQAIAGQMCVWPGWRFRSLNVHVVNQDSPAQRTSASYEYHRASGDVVPFTGKGGVQVSGGTGVDAAEGPVGAA